MLKVKAGKVIAKYLPNAWESMGRTYYVAQNSPEASDGNPGTQNRPFKTITKAVSVMDMYDAVIIDEGVYREEVPVPRNGHMYEPKSLITFKAMPGKQVYLKGSDVFDGEWNSIDTDVYKACLPEHLFKKNTYNPYELSIVIDEPGRVRPAKGHLLPETLGQIYLDGEPYEQVNRLEEVLKAIHSFVVSENGKEIIVHCDPDKKPKDYLVELTMRQRCFKPQFAGPLFIQTIGMVIHHAAEPGAFSLCRPFSIRKNRGAGIVVKKMYNVPGASERDCSLFYGNIIYISPDKPTLISSVIDDTEPRPLNKLQINDVISEDNGRTWKPTGKSYLIAERSGASHFLDPDNGMLVRYWRKCLKGFGLDGTFAKRRAITMLETSKDQGKTWRNTQELSYDDNYFRIIKLHDGTLLWLYTENQREDGGHHSCMKTLLGYWNKDNSSIEWQDGGMLEIDPQKSAHGLDEPGGCQFPDGRIFAVLRQGVRLPSQDYPGTPSVKLFTVSEDNGKTWKEPKPLTYENGKYVYSPRSYQSTFCSSKNSRPYVIMNINDGCSCGCDPRRTLQIAEIDPHRLCVKRNSVAVIETKHEEHHSLVRFSNWQMIEDRYTKNLLLFMKLHMSEYCPVRNGYDCNSYRYEIILPD